MIEIQEVDNDAALTPAVVSHLIPTEIPAEFKHGSNSRWNQLFNDWFFLGLKSLDLKPKEGVDKEKALRHIKAIMASYEPPHQEKEAAVAYLLSEWFSDVKWQSNDVKF